MTIYHSSNYAIAKQKEVAAANFCGGHTGTKNSPDNLETGDLSAMDKIVSLNPPLAQPIAKVHYGAMDGEYGTVIKEKTMPGTGSIVQWLQTITVSDMVGTAANSAFGAIPESEDWHLEVGTTYIDMYGVLTKSLTFTLDGVGGKVLQSREVISTQLDETAQDLNVPAQAATAPVLAKDVTIAVDTGGDNNLSADLSIPGFTHSITIELKDEEHVIGSQYVLEPTIIGRTHAIGFNSNQWDSNTWFADLLNYTIQKFTIVITYGSVVKFTYTNMTPSKVIEHNIPGRGRIVNDYGFIPTEDTTVTVATP